MYRTKAAAAAADMETAADRHSHWPDFAYQCKAIVVLLLLLLLWLLLLLLLLLGKLICSQLASLLLHAIWNLQSATQSLLNNGKMKLLENDCQTEAARAVAGHSACQLVAATHCTYTYIFIYVSKHPNKIFGILGLFFTAALLCLDLLRFLAASFPSCPPCDMQLVSIIKRQRIKLNAYSCLGMRSDWRAMSSYAIEDTTTCG